MNYLAHAYFSFNDADILLGNMISDFVKGKQQFDYPLAVQKGIQLHRRIDAYTDNHAITKELKKVFAPEVRLYAGAYVDIVYDHFLAIDKDTLSEKDWKLFAANAYDLLALNEALFPVHFRKMFPYMRLQNWLFNYRYIWGIENSFAGLVRRATYISPGNNCFSLFRENYTHLELLSASFLADVKIFAAANFTELKKQ